MRIALALERYHTAAHGDVDRTPMMRWSDSSPLVNDLMAAGIRLCSYMIGVDPERSQTLIVPLRSMHHACSDWRSQTFCADSLTDLNPSIARGATLQKLVSYSASATICGTRAVQRAQRRPDGEGRECSSP